MDPTRNDPQEISPTRENGEALVAAQQLDPAAAAHVLGEMMAKQAQVVKAIERQRRISPKAHKLDGRVLVAAIGSCPRV